MLVYQRVSPTNINNFAGRSSTMSLWYPLIGFSFCVLTMEVINRCFLHSCTRHSGSLQAHCEAVILTASVPPDSSCIAAGARTESRKVWTVGLLWFFRACAKCSKGTWGCWESDVCIYIYIIYIYIYMFVIFPVGNPPDMAEECWIYKATKIFFYVSFWRAPFFLIQEDWVILGRLTPSRDPQQRSSLHGLNGLAMFGPWMSYTIPLTKLFPKHWP